MKSKATPSHPNNIIMYEKRKATHDIITYSYFVCIKKVNILRMQCNHNKSELHPPTFTREIHFTQKYFVFSLSQSQGNRPTIKSITATRKKIPQHSITTQQIEPKQSKQERERERVNNEEKKIYETKIMIELNTNIDIP